MVHNQQPFTKRRFTRDFQRLVRLSTTSLTGFGVALLAIIAYAGWSSNTSAKERETVLLHNALNRGIARALNEQKSVAWWDDAVVKITDEAIDLEFTDSNFGVFLTETYGHDEVYILNGADKPLYAFRDGQRGAPSDFEERRTAIEGVIGEVRGHGNTALGARPDLFGADQKDYRTLSGALETAAWSGHILSVDGKLSIVAALTIVPNVDMSLLKGPPNLLVSIRDIDEDYVAAIGRSLLLSDLRLTSIPGTDPATVSIGLDGDDGARAGYLSWKPQKPGQVVLTVILPLLACGLVAVAGMASGLLGRLRSLSLDLADREEAARYAARHDLLSGLPNRAHFGEKLREALTRLEKSRHGERVIVAYLDVDRFKDINDTLGHGAGDALIKSVASRLKSALLPGDFLARYGGDEFAVMCSTSSRVAEDALAKRIETAFRRPFQVDSLETRVTASIGIAVAPDHANTADDIMRRADIALYEAKSRGRDRAISFSEDMARMLEERRSIEVDLRASLERGELRLNYQPIVSAATRRVVGIEALVRWRHPVRGEISPGVFIPIAEQSGLMPALGEWVIARAMEDSARWPHLQVSVNLSPVQFKQAGFDQRLRELIRQCGIDPGRFVLEITEGVLMECCDQSRLTLDTIHELGFKTALDDFGTGYSSLAYLCNFRFDKIKIDRAFVSGMSRSESHRKIVQSIVALGKNLGMDIVAEGVETEKDVETVTCFGCTELQGYHFSRPCEVEQLQAFLASYVPAVPDARRAPSQSVARPGTASQTIEAALSA